MKKPKKINVKRETKKLIKEYLEYMSELKTRPRKINPDIMAELDRIITEDKRS